jgi:hypothetical protein
MFISSNKRGIMRKGGVGFGIICTYEKELLNNHSDQVGHSILGGLEILLGGNTGFIKVKGNNFWGLDCKLTLHIDFNTAFLKSSLFTHLGVGGRL